MFGTSKDTRTACFSNIKTNEASYCVMVGGGVDHMTRAGWLVDGSTFERYITSSGVKGVFGLVGPNGTRLLVRYS